MQKSILLVGKPPIVPFLREQQFVSPGTYEFVVPRGVKEIKALVIGGGASYSGQTGGKGGGVISGIIPVKGGNVFSVTVGAVATTGGTSSLVLAGTNALLSYGGTTSARGGTTYNSSLVTILSNYRNADLPTTQGKACTTWLQMANNDWKYYPYYASSGKGGSATSINNGSLAPEGYGKGGSPTTDWMSGAGGGGAGVFGGTGNEANGAGGTGLGGGGGGTACIANSYKRYGGRGGSWSGVTPGAGGNGNWPGVSGSYALGGNGGSGYLMSNGGAGNNTSYSGGMACGGGGGGGKFGGYGGNGGTYSAGDFGCGGNGGGGGYGGNGGRGGSGSGTGYSSDGRGGNGGPAAVVIWY